MAEHYKKYRRRKKLIQPGVQLRMTLSFTGVAALALLLQFLLLGHFVLAGAQKIDGGGGVLASQVPKALLWSFGLSLAALLPVMFFVGVMLTFRFAGPAYRFETYLRALARGEQLGPCAVREGDELQSLCDAINLATEPLRNNVQHASPQGPQGSEDPLPESRAAA